MDSLVSQLLQRAREGDPSAADELFPLVYEELRRLAGAYLKSERRDHTLQATALVHEAFLRLVGIEQPDWQSKSHFFNAASRAMRRVLVDHARGRKRLKRGEGAKVASLDPAARVVTKQGDQDFFDVEALDAALSELALLNELQARVVELRYFGGLTEPEAALVLGVSQRKAAKDWAFARAWLRNRLEQLENPE
jgi:RNA polymerase sigma factor (TIGR02999 family)